MTVLLKYSIILNTITIKNYFHAFSRTANGDEVWPQCYGVSHYLIVKKGSSNAGEKASLVPLNISVPNEQKLLLEYTSYTASINYFGSEAPNELHLEYQNLKRYNWSY
ncbi:hypothetical protein F8M41_018691 [Gigaspora margarita]|uniref:Uncharacterized protein n=1 Tax=Gigaspora margarita TaxID=4874 RepID=A0A8H4AL20_GIGMA|nr:hypothetical protein F8M41_018691 [Gigaspora margarita]